MDLINRRTILRSAIGGAAVVGLAAVAWPLEGEAAPIALGKDFVPKASDRVEKAPDEVVKVQWHGPPPHRGWRRRRRRWVCWWRRGRRVCAWRWV